MPTDPKRRGNSPQCNTLYEVSAVCDRFEAELKSGNRPQIESYLTSWARNGLEDVFVELFALELHYRGLRGDRPTLEEYQRRFPQFTVEIAREFPAEVGDYDLIQLLGIGSFAKVYR